VALTLPIAVEYMRPFLQSSTQLKLMHDLAEASSLLRSASDDDEQGIQLKNVLDVQLVAEALSCQIDMDLIAALKCIDRQFFEEEYMGFKNLEVSRKHDFSVPLTADAIEHAGLGVTLLLRAESLVSARVSCDINVFVAASQSRSLFATAHDGKKEVAFDFKRDFCIASAEILRNFSPTSMAPSSLVRLTMKERTRELVDLLPFDIRMFLLKGKEIRAHKNRKVRNCFSNTNDTEPHCDADDNASVDDDSASLEAQAGKFLIAGSLELLSDTDVVSSNRGDVADKIVADGMLTQLSDIVLDIGRIPHCWIGGKRVFLCEYDPKESKCFDESIDEQISIKQRGRVVEQTDIDAIVDNIGGFGSDDRAGLEGMLHRISCIRDRSVDRNIVGLTLRVGRAVYGNAGMLLDILLGCEKSVLILGEPGSGKTTIIREATRVLSQSCNTVVIDTSCEIAGDGIVPHNCIGLARYAIGATVYHASNFPST
jgi:hypothetical protein